MITYDDFPLIERCVSSVIDYVDRIIAIDGRFEDFTPTPGGKDYSTDGTLKYLSSLENKEVVIIIEPGLSEVEKRNRYLVADENQWYLHLDADEWVENPEVLRDLPDTDVLFCPMLREGDGALHYYPRVFRHVEGLHYEGLHYRLVDGSSQLYADIHHVGDDYRSERFPLMIKHNRDGRDPERRKRKAIYYKTLTAREKEVKELLRYG